MFLPNIDSEDVAALRTMYLTSSFSDSSNVLTNFCILDCIVTLIGCIPDISGNKSLCVLGGKDHTLLDAMLNLVFRVSVLLLHKGYN